MRAFLLVSFVLIPALIVAGCTTGQVVQDPQATSQPSAQTQYVCPDGSVVSDPSLCPQQQIQPQTQQSESLEPECTSNWQCSDWSTCSSSGRQTRTCIDSNSCGITEGRPTETQSCTPPCTEDWSCGQWTECNAQGEQTRVCSDANGCGTQVERPIQMRSCTPSCIEDWQCTSWSECSESGTQTRTCGDNNHCGTTGNRPPISQSCTPPQRSWNPVTSISGVSGRTTDTFNIQGTKWRYTWSCSASSEFGLFSALAYAEGQGALYVSIVYASNCPETDTSVVYQGSGNYYFNVVAANLDGWAIQVEDWY